MNSEPRSATSTNPAERVHSYVGLGERRRVLGAVLVAVLALAALALIADYRARPRTQVSPERVQPLPENAEQSAAGYSFTRSEHDHPVFTIRAQRSLDLKGGGGTILEGVEVEIFGRAGDRHDLLRTHSCEYKPESGDFFCAGRVEIELGGLPGSTVGQSLPRASSGIASRARQPIYLETSALSYNQQKSLATTAAPVEWHYGGASGSAVGLTYDTRAGQLELEHEVAASLPVRAPDQRRGARHRDNLAVSAARLRYQKGQIDLAGPLEVDEGGRQVTAGHAIAYLDAQNRITRAVLEQDVRASDPSSGSRGDSLTAQANTMQAEFDPASGQLKQIQADGGARVESKSSPGSRSTLLEADHVQTNFEGAHFNPTHGTASGNVHLSSNALRHDSNAPGSAGASEGSVSSADLRASAVEFSFRPADGTLQQAHTLGPGKLVLVPSSSKAGNREVTAGQFDMAFDARSRLESVVGAAPTRVVFEPAPGAPHPAASSESRARSLRAKLNPESGGLESIEQSGQFQFLDGDERATADGAQFSADIQALTLSGKPELSDPATRIDADHVVMHLSAGTAEGFGHVSSTRQGGVGQDGGVRLHQTASPGFSSPNTNVLADRVTADRARSVLHYEGHVRAWQGADMVESPAIDIYRTERRIVAGSPVLTSDLAPALKSVGTTKAASGTRNGILHGTAQSNHSQPVGATEPVVIRADRLEYFDAEHRAAYRGHVRMDCSGATLASDRLDAYFAEQTGGASTLDRVVADGDVKVVEPGRRATGNHAEYDAAQGKVVLTGGPPTVYDADRGFLTGRVLTFFTEGDSLLVDGGNGYRTFSEHRSAK